MALATIVRLASLAALLYVALGAQAAAGIELRTGAFSPARPAPEFVLQGSDGSEFKLSRYRGKVVALGFGYTYCPDVCPTTLYHLSQVRKALGAAGKDFQVVYVTVDPERDNVARLREYVAAFDPSFVGATGTSAQLADVRKAYGIQIARKDVAGKPQAYQVHHSSFIYLIDPQGALRAMMPFGTPVEDVTHDVNALLGRKP
jgi:protein SCO1